MEQNKKNIVIIIAAAVIIILAVGYYFLRVQKKTPSATELAVPQVNIQNNPIEGKVPVINPVERANPFKYQNPLVK